MPFTNQVIWENGAPYTIHYNNRIYSIIYYCNRFSDGSYYAYVRGEDGKYGMFEITERAVVKVHLSGFDDLFEEDLSSGLYESIDGRFERDDNGFPSHNFSECEPLCFVFRGVNHLLTCYPVWIMNSCLEFGIPFVCEAFGRESFFLNGCEFNHSLTGESIGRAWYKTAYRKINYEEGGFNEWSAYEYAKKPNSIEGTWFVVDHNDEDEKHRVDDIVACDIEFADFWHLDDTYLIGVTRESGKAIIRIDKTPDGTERKEIPCIEWDCLETNKDTIFLLKTHRGIRFYSRKLGYLSDTVYLGLRERFTWEAYHKDELFTLIYLNSANKVEYEYLVINDGLPQINKIVIR